MIFSERLLCNNSKPKVTLTVTTNPASATCTLTYNGVQYTTKSLEVNEGSTVSYSLYHATYGTQTGSVIMDSAKTLTCEGTYNTDYTDVSWSAPHDLSSNRTLGGDSFAVYANKVQYNYNIYNPWVCFNGTTADNNVMSLSGGYMEWYNPEPIKISQIRVVSRNYPNFNLKSGNVYGSPDGSDWTLIHTFSGLTAISGQTATITFTTTSLYKYWKIDNWTAGNGYWQASEIYLDGFTQTTSYTYYWNVTTT